MPTPKYDVAISFLSNDTPTAKELYDKLSVGLSVFFYPRNQENLAGTSGLETLRLPFLEQSRLNIVLYRSGWGKTDWTRIEETAITEACLKGGWNKLFFIVLDDGEQLPAWLPEQHIRFNLKDFSINEAVGAIKLRVQEQGGSIKREDASSNARIVKQRADHLAEKKRLFSNMEWIRETVQPAVSSVLEGTAKKAREIARENELPFSGTANNRLCTIHDGHVSVVVTWHQEFSNQLESAYFQVTDFNGVWAERGYYIVQPEELQRIRYFAELSLDGVVCWIEDGIPSTYYSNESLADKIVRRLLSLFDRRQHGELPSAIERMLNNDNE